VINVCFMGFVFVEFATTVDLQITKPESFQRVQTFDKSTVGNTEGQRSLVIGCLTSTLISLSLSTTFWSTKVLSQKIQNFSGNDFKDFASFNSCFYHLDIAFAK